MGTRFRGQQSITDLDQIAARTHADLQSVGASDHHAYPHGYPGLNCSYTAYAGTIPAGSSYQYLVTAANLLAGFYGSADADDVVTIAYSILAKTAGKYGLRFSNTDSADHSATGVIYYIES
jgi:hypothetical protein